MIVSHLLSSNEPFLQKPKSYCMPVEAGISMDTHSAGDSAFAFASMGSAEVSGIYRQAHGHLLDFPSQRRLRGTDSIASQIGAISLEYSYHDHLV